MKKQVLWLIVLSFFPINQALAASPDEILQGYEREASKGDTAFKGFSAARGQQLYSRKQTTKKGEISCSSCHTPDPRKVGLTRANKNIEPLAPVANAKRFTDLKQVEKWFTRNCDDVLQRACTAQEKGDFLTYLLSIK